MKKIIAAALSVLVGAFGYTIVDSTIDERVSRLESEVYELREEISGYHPSKHTNKPNPTEYKTTLKIETPSYIPPTGNDFFPMGTTTPNNHFNVGNQLVKSPNFPL